jgi:adenosylcobinamide-GDP ribazoletransferase
VPAARHDGLGVLVASSVRTLVALGVVVVAVVVAGVVDLPSAAAVLAGVVAGEVLLRLAVRRLAGITGDVLGAVCETATTTALVVLAAT